MQSNQKQTTTRICGRLSLREILLMQADQVLRQAENAGRNLTAAECNQFDRLLARAKSLRESRSRSRVRGLGAVGVF